MRNDYRFWRKRRHLPKTVFFFWVLLNMRISSILQASAEPPRLSALAGSHRERRTVGQAARCGTLLGLRQQLCKGLFLQPTLAGAGRSHRSDVENHTAAPSHRPPARLLAVGSRVALPDNRSGIFHAHIKICSICRCARLSPGSPRLKISILFFDAPAIWLKVFVGFFSFSWTFFLSPDDARTIMQIMQQFYELYISIFLFLYFPCWWSDLIPCCTVTHCICCPSVPSLGSTNNCLIFLAVLKKKNFGAGWKCVFWCTSHHIWML